MGPVFRPANHNNALKPPLLHVLLDVISGTARKRVRHDLSKSIQQNRGSCLILGRPDLSGGNRLSDAVTVLHDQDCVRPRFGAVLWFGLNME